MAEIDPVVLRFLVENQQATAAIRAQTRTFDQQFGTQEKRVKKLEAEMRASTSRIGLSFQGLAASLGTYFTGRELIGLIDGFTRLQNQLKVAGLEGQQLADVQERLFALGAKYGVSVNALAELYGKASQAAKELGASQDQLLSLTEATSQSLLITGTSTEQASGAILGLSQALASGIVRAEEFNQINEGGLRPLLEAAAATERFGGSVAKLRIAVTDGKVSSQELYEAILANADLIEGKAAKATITLSGAFQALRDQLMKYAGEAGQGSGATAVFAEAIKALADNLDTLIPILAVIAAAMGTNLVVGTIAASRAFQVLSAYAAVATTSLAGTALAGRAAGAALMSALSGPLLPITALVVGLGYLFAEMAKAKAEGERLAAAADRNADAFLGAAGGAKAQADETSGLSREQIIAKSAALGLKLDTDRLADSHYAAAAAARAQAVEEQRLALLSSSRKALARSKQDQFGALAPLYGTVQDTFGLDNAFTKESGAAFLNSPEYKTYLRDKATLEAMMNAPIERFAPPSGSSSSPSATTTKPRKTKAGRSAEEIERRFVDELDRYRAQTASAQASSAKSADERAELDLRGVELARRAALRDLEANDDYSAAQKTRLRAAIETAAEEERIQVEIARRAQLEQEAADLAETRHQAAVDGLRAQLDLADNDHARKDIALQIFDAEEAYLRSKLEAVALSETANDAEKERARIALDALNATSGARRAGVEQSNATEVERYLKFLNRSTAAINESIDSIKIDGLEALNDGIVDAIMGAESLGDVFSKVADQIISDLLRIAIQQAIIKPLGNALFGSGDGLGGLIGGIFGGGSPTNLLAGTPYGGARANGGPVSPGSAYLVGERGKEVFVPDQSGLVIPNQQLRTGQAASGGVATVRLELSGDIDARITRVSGPIAVEVVRAAAPTLIENAANETLRRANRPGL